MGVPGWLGKAASTTHAEVGEDGWWYAAAVLVGAVLIVATAINQPYSYDEITQIAPYGSDSVAVITGATRQPPLDPLLGAMFQHLLGVGQLRQRLVPVLSGIGTLVLMSLLLRRLDLARAGAFGVLVLATTPLMVRYSAYTRPYALPLFLMLLFAYATQQWLEQRRVAWLAVVALAAVALPLARVPEPTVFLGTTAVVMTWLTLRGRFSWSQSWALITISLGALIFVGVPMFLTLRSETGSFFDPSISGLVDRFGSGVHEVVWFWAPLMTSWFPWWPITVLAIVATLMLSRARRRLGTFWFWWPLLAGPVAFALAYHFLNPFPFEDLPYRARAAYFFAPAYSLLVVALASVVTDARAATPRLRLGLAVLVGAVFLGQLSTTADVVLDNAAPDFNEISQVLTQDLPDDAIVLYDRPAPIGQGRQPFLGAPRYMDNTPHVETVADLTAQDTPELPDGGPVYVLVNGQCASSGRCQPTSTSGWHDDVPGWRISCQQERFTLYEPVSGQDGTAGVISALKAFGTALGPELGYTETYAGARLLQQEGRRKEGSALIQAMYAQATPDVAARLHAMAEWTHLDALE